MTLEDIIAALKADRALCRDLSSALVRGGRMHPRKVSVACWVRDSRNGDWNCEPIAGARIAWVFGSRAWWMAQEWSRAGSRPVDSETEGIRRATAALEAQGWTIHQCPEETA